MDNGEQTQSTPDNSKPETNEAPRINILGSFAALTEGVPGAGPADVMHSGVMS